nr:chemotaxis protein CheB [Luteimonas galliterrae]
MGGESRAPRDATQDTIIGLDEFLSSTGSGDAPAEIPAAVAPRTIKAGEWSLDDGETRVGASRSASVATTNIEELERRIAGLSLADTDSYGHGPQRGAVLLLAGLGGPDAVRQLLKGLPEGFPRPVLILQRLDGGQYDKLVGQMARASAMPVQLAAADTVLEAGNVYVVPPSLGLARKAADLVFSGSADVFGALPANDSAIVVLSGGDVATVDPIMRLAAAGALVAGQSAEGCFEPAAANDVVARGGEAGLPAALAERLAERWPA